MARFLITGGGGFVALHTAEAALARGHAVTLFDLAPLPGYAGALTPTAQAIRGDVRDRAALAAAAEGATHVIHCAAVVGPDPAKADPVRAVEVNVCGTSTVLELARVRGMPVVNLSTATLYGHRPDLEPLDETAPPEPIGVYDATKLMAETLCATYRKTFAVDVASIRTGFVFGYGSRIGEYFLPRVLRGEAIEESSGAAHSCDFTYVADLAQGLVACAEAVRRPEPIYNITTGVRRTRGDLAAAVRALVPGAVIRQGPGVDPARHLRGKCLIARATRDFGYAPRFTLESGLAHWRDRIRALGPAP
ncbi:MAG: NAD(P)-dependent oxidoreductase [Alphaproteobacteria bacterium]|nr:NAD(P)-dependent oxidoreductase [Alphaproteobacteria bacterium]